MVTEECCRRMLPKNAAEECSRSPIQQHCCLFQKSSEVDHANSPHVARMVDIVAPARFQTSQCKSPSFRLIRFLFASLSIRTMLQKSHEAVSLSILKGLEDRTPQAATCRKSGNSLGLGQPSKHAHPWCHLLNTSPMVVAGLVLFSTRRMLQEAHTAVSRSI
jgi:hypothetical protein